MNTPDIPVSDKTKLLFAMWKSVYDDESPESCVDSLIGVKGPRMIL